MVSSYKQKYEAIDQSTFEEFQKVFENNENAKTTPTELWIQECEVEESVSKNRWTEKENFLLEQELYGTKENFNLAQQNEYPDARKFNHGY